jgi:glycosyltransferase involved in cell wall biosynthesis
VARAGDAEHLAECIARVLDMGGERRQQMSEACRRVAVAEYDVKLQAKRYVELFEEMVEKRKA